MRAKEDEKITANEVADAPMGAFEIAPGMTVEEMSALFFDNALIEPPYRVFQLNSSGHRYYYKFNEHGEPEFYPSVTTILSETRKQSPFLLKWVAEKGIEEAERYKNERAAYGTFMHAQFEDLLIRRNYNLDNLKSRLKDYIEQQSLPVDFIYYADDLKKDVLAFAQFVIDYDVRPLAVEIALVHPELGYAGMIDLPCSLMVKPGADERINAIVDFKSGRKGFFEEHEVQLHLYKMMWNANFPHQPIDRVFNFAPKDWRKRPSYTFKDQTDAITQEEIPYLLGLARIAEKKRNNVFTSISGVIELRPDIDLSENITSLTLAEVIKSRQKQAKEKAQEPGTDVGVDEADLTQAPKQKNGMTCSDFENEMNVVAPYSLCEVTDIAKSHGVELVEKGLNLDNHRWYSVATNIYKCSDGFVKVTGAYQNFSESQTWEDINVWAEAEKLQGKELRAFELRMEAKEIENAPETAPGPMETKTAKAATRKKVDKAANKPAKSSARVNTPTEEETANKRKKQANNEAVSNLLSKEIDL